jgi:hypothetical protein
MSNQEVPCFCSQEINVFCPLCDTKMGTEKHHCEQHDPVMICGKPRPACRQCESRGLTFISGHGGPPYVYDNITDKNYSLHELPLKPLIKHFPDFETRKQICHCSETVELECMYCSTYSNKKVIGTVKKYCATHDAFDHTHRYSLRICDICEFKQKNI